MVDKLTTNLTRSTSTETTAGETMRSRFVFVVVDLLTAWWSYRSVPRSACDILYVFMTVLRFSECTVVTHAPEVTVNQPLVLTSTWL